MWITTTDTTMSRRHTAISGVLVVCGVERGVVLASPGLQSQCALHAMCVPRVLRSHTTLRQRRQDAQPATGVHLRLSAGPGGRQRVSQSWRWRSSGIRLLVHGAHTAWTRWPQLDMHAGTAAGQACGINHHVHFVDGGVEAGMHAAHGLHRPFLQADRHHLWARAHTSVNYHHVWQVHLPPALHTLLMQTPCSKRQPLLFLRFRAFKLLVM